MNKFTPPPPPPRNCPICGNDKHSIIFEQQFAEMGGIEFLTSYSVVLCNQCGFLYASNIPDQEVFDNYYITENRYEDKIKQPDTITGVHENVVQEILRLDSDKGTSIVDVGCARSEVLRSLKFHGYSNLTGIDPSAANIEYLRRKGINAIRATIETLEICQQYNFVLFLYVLEHVSDLNSVLNILYKIVQMDGVLVIKVPNISQPASGRSPYQEFCREHVNFFTPESLSNLMSCHGFQIISYQNNGNEIAGFFRKVGKNNRVKKDRCGEGCVRRYIEQSKKYEDFIYANLKSKYAGTEVIVWGISTFTERMLAKGVLDKIVFLVDSNPKFWGKTFAGIEVLSPQEVKKQGYPIIIATSIRYVDAITQTIRNDLKLENEVCSHHFGCCFEYRVDNI